MPAPPILCWTFRPRICSPPTETRTSRRCPASSSRLTVFDLYSNFTTRLRNFDSIPFDASGEYAGLTFSDIGGGEWRTGFTGNNQQLRFTTSTGELVVVPEPSAYVLAVIGIGVGLLHRRRRMARRSLARAVCQKAQPMPVSK